MPDPSSVDQIRRAPVAFVRVILRHSSRMLGQSDIRRTTVDNSQESNIVDCEGFVHDWVELKNVSSTPLLLSNYFLSDTKNFIQKNMDKCQARCVYKIWNIK